MIVFGNSNTSAVNMIVRVLRMLNVEMSQVHASDLIILSILNKYIDKNIALRLSDVVGNGPCDSKIN